MWAGIIHAAEKALFHFEAFRYLSLLINTTGYRNKLQCGRKTREKQLRFDSTYVDNCTYKYSQPDLKILHGTK